MESTYQTVSKAPQNNGQDVQTIPLQLQSQVNKELHELDNKSYKNSQFMTKDNNKEVEQKSMMIQQENEEELGTKKRNSKQKIIQQKSIIQVKNQEQKVSILQLTSLQQNNQMLQKSQKIQQKYIKSIDQQKLNIQQHCNKKQHVAVQIIVQQSKQIQIELKDLTIQNKKQIFDQRVQFIQKEYVSVEALNKLLDQLKQKHSIQGQDQIENNLISEIQTLQQIIRQFGQQDQQIKQDLRSLRQKIIDLIDIEVLYMLLKQDPRKKQYEDLKIIIQNAIKQYKISSLQTFQKTLKTVISSNQKKLKIYQKKQDLQKISTLKKQNHKINHLIQSLPRYLQLQQLLTSNNNIQIQLNSQSSIHIDDNNQKMEIKRRQGSSNLKNKQEKQINKQIIPQKKYINFKLNDKKQIRKLQYEMTDTPSDLMRKLGYQQINSVQIQILNQQNNKFIILNIQKPLSQYLDFYSNYQAIVKKLYKVNFQGIIKNYAQGTDILKIRKIQGKKNQKYNFYHTNQKKQYKQDQLYDDIQMVQVESINIYFGQRLNKNIDVPINIPIQEAILYLNMNELIQNEKLKNIFIAKIKVGSDEISVHYTQKVTIKYISKGNIIEYITLSYPIKLFVQLFTQKNNKQVIFNIFSDDKLDQLKLKFKSICQLQQQLQQWMINQQQLNDNQTFISKRIFQNAQRINVKQLKNIQYYGFSKPQMIRTQTFINYYIENDNGFKDMIKSSGFPDPKYQHTFRTICLGIIFSTIKKHCKIQMALKHIKKLIKQIDFDNQTINEAKIKLWQSTNKNKISYFNQFYVLHNILLSSSDDLRVELMNIYKNHSPLFMVTLDQRGNKINYLDAHFWINTKSFVISSIGYGDIKGKSNLLNHIFNLNFELKSNRHPLSAKSVMIQYNIYKNEDCMVDLIDVAFDSLSQQQVRGLCQYSNLVMIHCVQQNYKDALKWIQDNVKDKPYIIFQRDDQGCMDQVQQYKKQLQKNNLDDIKKQYRIPQLTKQNIIHYDDQIQYIMDQIHTFIQKSVKNSDSNCWNFSYFLAKDNKKRQQIVDILKQIQTHFTQIVNIQLLKGQLIQQNIKKVLSPIMRKILDLINNQDNYGKFMSKLRQSIRITRTKRIKQFSSINYLQKMVEVKDQKKIKQNQTQIKKHIEILQKIKQSQKTIEFSNILNQIKLIQSYSTNQNVQKLQIYFKYLNTIFIQNIKIRQFSIQNFWRCLNKLFYSDIKLNHQLDNYLTITKSLFNKQFKAGKTLEIINGDTLQIPLPLLKSAQIDIENTKVIVVGIFGPQSSGKSTLLNYLFGCDFASSDGRCTNGIYGTYYQIQNGCLPCKGIFILDTEGLFSNYKRTNQRGNNFDNKLVLFLLKVCDILILNTRGDIDKNCQNILQLSFDSVLMQHKQGAIYPNFYIVLNQSMGTMNQQQQLQVRQLRQKITSVNKQMQKYISTNETNSMPIAFNISSNKNTNSQTLKRIQRKTKTPTDQFYQQTKLLSLRLIQIIKQRGRNRQPKLLVDIYDHMNAVWTSILNSPMLTMHASKQLKILDQRLQNFSFGIIKDCQNQINSWENTIPKQFQQFQNWEQSKNNQFKKMITQTLKQINKNFPYGSDPQINSIIKDCTDKVNLNLVNYYDSFKIKSAQKRISLQFDKNKKRGVEGLMKIAKQLRKNAYKNNIQLTDEYKLKNFQLAWQNHVKILQQRLNVQKISIDKYKQIRQYYINQVCMQKSSKKCVPKNNTFSIDAQKNYQDYSRMLKQKLLNQSNNNFYFYFTQLNIQPIISIKKGGAQSIPQQYLSMKTLFSFEPTIVNYYLSADNLGKFLNNRDIGQSILQKLIQSKAINTFYHDLKQDLHYFKVKIHYQAQFKKYLAQNAYKFIKHSTCKYNVSIDDLKQIDPYFFGFIKASKYVSEKQSTTGLFKSFKDMKNLHQRGSKLKVLSDKIVVKAVKQQECTFFESIRWSQLSIIKKILKDSIYHFVISLYSQSASSQFKRIHQQILNEIAENFASIGVYINTKQSLVTYHSVDIYENSFYGNQKYKQVQICYQFKLLKQNPIQIISWNQFLKSIQILPYYFNKVSLSDSYSIYKSQYYSYLVGQQTTQKIKVIQTYQNVPELKDYINKNYENLLKGVKTLKFRNFIFKHIKIQLIFNKIIQKIQKQHDMKSMEDLVSSILIFIKKQIALFNLDLRQISHQLSYDFLVSIYDFACNLISKKIQSQQIIKVQQKKQNLKEEEQKQKTMFLNILNKDSQKRCRQYATYFVDAYSQHIISIINKLKKNQIQQKKKIFLKKYKRRQFQKQIDKQMQNCTDQLIAQKYLLQPKQYLIDEYNKLVEQQIHDYLDELFDDNVMSAINEMKLKFRQQNIKLKNNEYNWQADTLFKNLTQDQNASTELKKIFFKLLTQKYDIDQKYQYNYFKLKNNIYFENLIYMESKINQDFINNANFESIEIQNYAFFIQYICDQLDSKQANIKQSCQFSLTQKQQFRVAVEFKSCPFDCPFCGRLCDVDIRQSLQHQIHQCVFGHQMRALKNIRIQINQNSKNVYYASIMRCQEIDDFTIFDYDGAQKVWLQQKKMFPNWSFESKCERTQKLMFQRLWCTAGRRICKIKQAQQNMQMKFIDFSQYDQKIKQKQNKNSHYIFSIDGSGSMSCNNKWNQQINQLQQILSQLAKNVKNKVSICIFTDDPNIIAKKQYPESIYPKSFAFPGGATVYEAVAAFKGAIQIIQETGFDMNTHFVYLSDGHGVYPDVQITRMLFLKLQLQKKGFEFSYTSILIGGDSHQPMQKINQRMNGNTQWVKTAGQIAHSFKQVLKKAKTSK